MPPLLVQAAVAAAIFTLYLISTPLLLKDDQGRRPGPAVLRGAGLTGLIVGGLVAFVILPNAFSLPDLQPYPISQLMTWDKQLLLLPAAIGVELARHGALASVPGLAAVFSPHRRAVLQRRKRAIDRQLGRLDGLRGAALAA